MLDNLLVQIAIVLFFVYFALSLIASIIQESIADLFDFRSRNLRACLTRALSDKTYGGKIAKRFFGHPLMTSLNGGQARLEYVEPGIFVVALAQAVQPRWSKSDPVEGLPASIAALEDGELKQKLDLIISEAGASRAQIESDLSLWFDSLTDRMSRAYRIKASMWAFGIAAIITIAFNVSTIEIIKFLKANDELRERATAAVSSVMQDFEQQHLDALTMPGVTGEAAAGTPAFLTQTDQVKERTQTVNEVIGCLKDDLGLPIGWDLTGTGKLGEMVGQFDCALATTPEAQAALQKVAAGAPSTSRFGPTIKQDGFLIVIAGWFITAFAVSRGAPFWFHLLKRVVGRGSPAQPLHPTTSVTANRHTVVRHSSGRADA